MQKVINRQQGITLIVCMIVLLVITLLGLSSIRDTSMEERMAGNMKSQNVAFQAAESALREGERFIETIAVLPDFDGTNGLYPQLTEPWPASASSWAVSSAVRSFSGSLSGAAGTPVYIIEQMDAESALASSAAGQVMNTTAFYRITTRAVGNTETARIVLQSIYRR